MPAGRPKGSRDISAAKIAAIIVLRTKYSTPFVEIATDLRITNTAAGQWYSRIKHQANNSTELLDLLDAIPQYIAQHKKHRIVKVPAGSELSKRIRAEMIRFAEYKFEDATAHILAEAGISLSYNTLRKIAYYYRDEQHNYAIVRGVRAKKPALSSQDMFDRVNYCDWLLLQYKLSAGMIIFVCYDETSKPIGGLNNRGGKKYITRPVGVNSNQVAIHYKPAPFILMICAACSTDVTIRRPCKIWVQPSDDDASTHAKQVDATNKQAYEAIQRKRSRAEVAGTHEEKALRELNNNIQRSNKNAYAANRAAGLKGGALRRGIRKPYTAERLYSFREFSTIRSKGINGTWFGENILKELLLPYYCAIRQNNPGKQVFLVMDNVRLHGVGLRYCEPELQELHIERAPHPPNSPDLHPIERCFGRLEGFLQDYKCLSASQQAQADAAKTIQQFWQDDYIMEAYIKKRLRTKEFMRLAIKCKIHGGNNNYTG